MDCDFGRTATCLKKFDVYPTAAIRTSDFETTDTRIADSRVHTANSADQLRRAVWDNHLFLNLISSMAWRTALCPTIRSTDSARTRAEFGGLIALL